MVTITIDSRGHWRRFPRCIGQGPFLRWVRWPPLPVTRGSTWQLWHVSCLSSLVCCCITPVTGCCCCWCASSAVASVVVTIGTSGWATAVTAPRSAVPCWSRWILLATGVTIESSWCSSWDCPACPVFTVTIVLDGPVVAGVPEFPGGGYPFGSPAKVLCCVGSGLSGNAPGGGGNVSTSPVHPSVGWEWGGVWVWWSTPPPRLCSLSISMAHRRSSSLDNPW